MIGGRERVYVMSHDRGFRRSDRDSTQQPARWQQKRSKASTAYEDRLKRRHVAQEWERRRADDAGQATDD